ncbi:hypothetical protein, partial [Faecalibaculum rodentium]
CQKLPGFCFFPYFWRIWQYLICKGAECFPALDCTQPDPGTGHSPERPPAFRRQSYRHKTAAAFADEQVPARTDGV